MSKTPEEIKKDLAAWGVGVRIDIGCGEFVPPTPEYMLNDVRSADVCRDALAYIQQLEQIALHWQSCMDQVQKTLQTSGFGSLEEFLQAFSQVKREREVMLQDMKHLAMGSDYCDTCKHGKSEIEATICQSHDFCCEKCSVECACKDCFGCTNWEWRGVPEKEEAE